MSEQDPTPPSACASCSSTSTRRSSSTPRSRSSRRATASAGVLHGEDMGLFIGRHGQTIDAVQHLAFKVAAHGESPAPKVEVDAAGYRDRRRQALERQADQAAADAVRSSRPVALDAMSATERKVVHEYLKDRGDVETYSEGTEPDRHLVVAPLGD